MHVRLKNAHEDNFEAATVCILMYGKQNGKRIGCHWINLYFRFVLSILDYIIHRWILLYEWFISYSIYKPLSDVFETLQEKKKKKKSFYPVFKYSFVFFIKERKKDRKWSLQHK